jgi:hypothetical protein
MYWLHADDMSSVSLVACHQHMLGLSALLQWLCWERNWGGSCGSLSRAERWSREHFFSGAVYLSDSVDDFTKCCYIRTTWDTYGRGLYTDWAWKVCDMLIRFPLQGVHRFESPWLSDMSNRLFVAVFTLLINDIIFINEVMALLYINYLYCYSCLA